MGSGLYFLPLQPWRLLRTVSTQGKSCLALPWAIGVWPSVFEKNICWLTSNTTLTHFNTIRHENNLYWIKDRMGQSPRKFSNHKPRLDWHKKGEGKFRWEIWNTVQTEEEVNHQQYKIQTSRADLRAWRSTDSQKFVFADIARVRTTELFNQGQSHNSGLQWKY